jgi:hypothetical protein
MKRAIYIIGLLTVIILISNKHLALAFGIIIFAMYSYNKSLNLIKEELSWISKSLVDENTYKDIKDRTRFYDLIYDSIINGKIRIGMSIEEINIYLKNFIKQYQEDIRKGLEFRRCIYFKHSNKTNNDIVLKGYGKDMPTSELILKIRNGKLIKIKGGKNPEFNYAVKKHRSK